MTWNDVYEYENGNLYAKDSVNPKYPKGRKVGYVDQRGYVRTKLGSKMTFAHRIIWEMFNGAMPEGKEIDHINGVKSDNRIENLRLCDRRINCKNAAKRRDNSSGVTGVSKTYNGKWVVQIQYNGNRIAKRFDHKEDAVRYAECFYKEKKDFTERHGK